MLSLYCPSLLMALNEPQVVALSGTRSFWSIHTQRGRFILKQHAYYASATLRISPHRFANHWHFHVMEDTGGADKLALPNPCRLIRVYGTNLSAWGRDIPIQLVAGYSCGGYPGDLVLRRPRADGAPSYKSVSECTV